MHSSMSIEEYLSQGGVLTSPANVPARYRGELMRLMASFVDSELAGSAGFADAINDAPGVKSRIAAARIVLEKIDHAERVLAVMESFGADTARYVGHHDWAARMDRDADLSAARHGGDMRLSVFHFPLQGWTDAVAMNALMGLATSIQLAEMSRISYAPLADALRAIAPREQRHAELGWEGVAQLVEEGRQADLRAAIDYWRPRVAATFGAEGSTRFETQKKLGLRHAPNEALRAEWDTALGDKLAALGLQ